MEPGLQSHGIVAVIRNHAGKFLLLEEARQGPTKGYWVPPHGRCKMSDQSEEAGLIREVCEETGLQITPVKKVLTMAADTKVKTVSFWLVETDNAVITLNAETSRSGWFSLDEALALTAISGHENVF